MDTNKEFILMCAKAVEMQGLWNPTIGDFWVYEPIEKYINIAVVGSQYRPINKSAYINDRVWLPRQDQLQSLSKLSWKEFDKECAKYDMPTKEQAGLRVIMKLMKRVDLTSSIK